MELRRDALAGAARAVLALRDEARSRDDMTANVGVISAEPGGFNVVPGAAELTIDVRSPTADGFARLEPFVRETLERIAAEEGLGLELRETHRKQPVALDPELQDRLEAAARRRARRRSACRAGRARRDGARPPRPGGDALRPQPRRPQPHARRVLLARALRARARACSLDGRRVS